MITETTEEEEQWLYRINEQIFGPVSRHILSERLVSGKVSPEIQVARNQGEFHHISRVSIFRSVLETRNQNLEDQRRRSQRNRLIVALLILAGGCAASYHVVNEQIALLKSEEKSQFESVIQERKDAFVRHQAIPLPDVEPLVTQEMLEAAQVEYDERMAAAEAKSKKSRSVRKTRARKSNAASVTDSCLLKPQDVFQVMSRYKGKIGTCVEQEKKRAAATGSSLPDTITLGFTVRPSGQVIQFDLGNPAYRKGLLFKCLKKTMKRVVFPKRGGSDCTTNLPVKISQ